MTNTDWKILIYLREEHSINKVAKRLFLTQPSLSYRLTQMEKEIGVPLFIRTNKGVQFTDAGNRLLSFAEKELQQYQDMRNYVIHEPSSVSGVLRIGVSRSFAQSHLPAILKGFLSRYTDVEISLTTDTSDRLVKAVKKEDIHLAIIRGDTDWNGFDMRLENAPLYLISAWDVEFDGLPSQPAIRYRSDPTLDEIRTQWWRRNFSDIPHFMITADDCLTCIEIINAGLGYSLVPEDMLKKCAPHINQTMITNQEGKPIHRPSRMILKHSMLQSLPIYIFADYVREYFRIKDPLPSCDTGKEISSRAASVEKNSKVKTTRRRNTLTESTKDTAPARQRKKGAPKKTST